MTINEQIEYWFNLADEDLLIVESLFSAEHYVWSLYLCQLALEKTLKGLFIQNLGEMPPKIHDLVKLAKTAYLDVDEETMIFLDDMNKFNIEARYPDYKSSIKKICTKDFTLEKISETMETVKWLKSLRK